MERIIIPAALAGAAYLVYRNKKKSSKPRPKPYKFPDEPLKAHFPSVINNKVYRLHWNLDPPAVNHYGFNATRAFGTSYESVWGKRAHEADGSHSWNDQIGYFKKHGSQFLLNEYNEEYLNAIRRWAEEYLKHDIAFIYSIFSGPIQGWAGNNDRGMIARSNREFYSLSSAWWNSGMIKNIISKVMDVLEGMPNIVLEVANEPFPFDYRFHEACLHFMESERQNRGWPELRYQINPHFGEAADLGMIFRDRLYISTHTHNTSLGMWDRIWEINPHTKLEGGSVRSWDNGSYRNFLGQDPERSLTEHLRASDRTGNSWESLFLDNHERMYEEFMNYVRGNV